MANPLVQLISKIVDDKLREYNKHVVKFWVAQVVAGSPSVPQNSNVDVLINGDLSSTPITVKNKSNETLTAGNQVYLVSTSGSLGDSVVLIKK